MYSNRNELLSRPTVVFANGNEVALTFVMYVLPFRRWKVNLAPTYRLYAGDEVGRKFRGPFGASVPGTGLKATHAGHVVSVARLS